MRFQVVFEGLQDWARQDEVHARLVEMFRTVDPGLAGLVRGQRPCVVKKGLDRETAEQCVQALAAAGARCRVEADPALELSEEDLQRIVAEWLRAESRPWRAARRWAAVRRYVRRGLLLLLVMGGLIVLNQHRLLPGALRSGPLRPVLALSDRLLSNVGSPAPRPDAGAHGEAPRRDRTVTVWFSFRGALALKPGDPIIVERWAAQPGGRVEAYRVARLGSRVEAEEAQAAAQTGRIAGVVNAVRRDGALLRFSLTVERAVYERELAGRVSTP